MTPKRPDPSRFKNAQREPVSIAGSRCRPLRFRHSRRADEPITTACSCLTRESFSLITGGTRVSKRGPQVHYENAPTDIDSAE